MIYLYRQLTNISYALSDVIIFFSGLTLTFGCLTGVPMLVFSDRIVERVGRNRVFFFGFLAYTVRMFGYSIIT